MNKFRAGAFTSAIKSNIPLIPLVIRGSRKILPAEKFLPVHGKIKIDILTAIKPNNKAYESSRSLSNLARKKILEKLNEPDLLLSKKK